MKPNLTSIAPKLGKLLPLLASPVDGEVLATVRAIGRTLQSAGVDFHDLTEALIREPASKPQPEPELDPQYWYTLVIKAMQAELRGNEEDFLANMARWTSDGRVPSEKQQAWIELILARMEERAAA